MVMKQNTTVKILEGVLAGAALGVAAGMLLAPKPGKKLRKDIHDMAADIYKRAAPKLKKMKKLGEAEYKAFMDSAAKTYGKAKKLSEKEIAALRKEARGSWKHLSKHF